MKTDRGDSRNLRFHPELLVEVRQCWLSEDSRGMNGFSVERRAFVSRRDGRT